MRSFDLRQALLSGGSRVTRLSRSRLLQFFAIGTVVWALSPAERSSREVVIESRAVLDALQAEQSRVARPLSADEKQDVMAALVADEVLFREGLRLGVGTDDAVVRARIADRMRGHLEATSTASITPEEVREEAARQAARMPQQLRLAVAFIGKDRPNAPAAADALARALAASPDVPAPYGGDRAPIEANAWWREAELARAVGTTVARAAVEAPVGSWSGPYASSWGFYVVRVLERRSPTEAEAMDAAAVEVRLRKRRGALDRALLRMSGDYDVRVQTPAGEPGFDPRRSRSGNAARGRGDGVD